MGNNPNRVKELEESLLSLSGLNPFKDIHVFDVSFEFRGELHYLHTIKTGSDDNPHVLVLLHGFGGSSVMYYKMLKKLGESYRVYCLDLLGMGLSSRAEFNCTTTEDTVEYFVESLEKWRITLGIEEFYLGGHSFGGYMACHYSVKYQNNVKKLFLLSPVGFTKANSEFNLEEEKKKEMGFWERRFFNLRVDFFLEKKTISSIFSRWGWLLNYFARKSMKERFRLSKEHADLLNDFLIETYKLPDSAQKALHYVINPNIIAYDPLEEKIKDLKMPIICFYGDKDWMNTLGAERVERNKMENFTLIWLDDCGHQVMMENPNDLANHLFIFRDD